MATDTAAAGPQVAPERSGAGMRFALAGDWTILAAQQMERETAQLIASARAGGLAVFDLRNVAKLDTAGAWVINRARHDLAHAGVSVVIEKARPEHAKLIEEAAYREFAQTPRQRAFLIVDILADIGRSLYLGLREFYLGVAFFGEVVEALLRVAVTPQRFRVTSLVYHMETIGFRSIPIIMLINLLVGAIVAQQGIFQLLRFGATSYTVDLIGILVLREMGVLLTSIMIAGRSGSAITAEIGSMKMREEIDALRVMGLSPIEILIVPRVLALVLSLPLLTFIADMAALFGGLLVSWSYGGISPVAFLSLLQAAIGRNTFFVGLIKAPFMALVIGLIAAMDGLATAGSAESLGRQVTSSVVKSIFMVIVIDGLFAMFFAAIHY